MKNVIQTVAEAIAVVFFGQTKTITIAVGHHVSGGAVNHLGVVNTLKGVFTNFTIFCVDEEWWAVSHGTISLSVEGYRGPVTTNGSGLMIFKVLSHGKEIQSEKISQIFFQELEQTKKKGLENLTHVLLSGKPYRVQPRGEFHQLVRLNEQDLIFEVKQVLRGGR